MSPGLYFETEALANQQSGPQNLPQRVFIGGVDRGKVKWYEKGKTNGVINGEA